ncbi:MAG: alpha/beta fold hydrolase [Actinobacteria bacterium]|nr:alpha/beta fold hydrolase [Actinomycetota bacterium]
MALHAAAPAILRRAFRVNRVRHDEGLPGDTIWIQGRRGKRLAARYLLPTHGDPQGVVLVMHGWSSSSRDMLEAAGSLNRAGFGALLVDARCHGDSDDDDLASMPRFAEDIESALHWLEHHRGVNPRNVVLLGHSVGAGAALLAARGYRVAGVIAVACMAHPREMMQASMARAGIPRPLVRYVLWRVQRILGQRFDDFAPVNTIRDISCPVLIVHGDEDTTVPLSDAHRLERVAGDRARLLVVRGADHRSREAFLQHATEITAFVRSCY